MENRFWGEKECPNCGALISLNGGRTIDIKVYDANGQEVYQ